MPALPIASRLPKSACLRLDDFALLDAAGTNRHAANRAFARFCADILKVRHETTFGDSRRVQTDATLSFGKTVTNNRVARLRTLTANFTYSGHNRYSFRKG